MNKRVKTLFAAMGIAAATVALTACSGKNKGTIKIGLSGPLTGGAASYGIAVANSAKMAVEEINAAGGYKGIKFEVTALDDQLEPTKASTNFDTLFEKGMQVSLGCVTSGACIEYGASAKKNNVFCLTPSATNDGVYAVGDNMYQMCFSDSGQGTASANYITENMAGKKIGIFYDSSDDYSKGIYDNFKAAYTGTITAEASFTGSSKDDFTSQVQTLKDCEVIFMPIYYSEAALFIDQAKDKVAPTAVYFGCDGLDGIESVDGFDANSYKQEISYLSHFDMNEAGKTKEYVDKYVAKYGKDTLNQFGASAYDCVYAILGAMNAYNGEIAADVTAADLCTILTAQFQGGYTLTDGVTGKNIKWNADGTVSKSAKKFVVNPNRAQ